MYGSLSEDSMPVTTSEDWVNRAPEVERWRQLGSQTCWRILNKAASGVSHRTMVVVALGALPIDWQVAVVELSRVAASV
jgi:hypothetical protein